MSGSVSDIKSAEVKNGVLSPRTTTRSHLTAAIPEDGNGLEMLGYKQELKRDYNKFEIFGLCFSIMSLAPSIASVLTDSISAGGVGLSWGWFVPMIFVTIVGFSMSQLASSMPTAGSLYYWTFKLSPERYRKFLSYLVGWADMMGLIAGGGSIFYGFALQLLSSVQLGQPQYTPTDGAAYGVFVAANVLAVALGYLPGRIMSKIQISTIYLNFIAVGILVISLPVGLRHKGISLNSGSYVFGNTDNATSYPYGWSFMLAWMAAIWTSSTLDSSTHLAEEAKDAQRAIPFSIILSSTLCLAVGFLIMCVIAAVIDPNNIDGLSNATLPLSDIIVRCLDDKWSIGIMSLFCFIQFQMGLSSVLATSRQVYAMARDNALPFSGVFKKVDRNGIPFFGLVFTTTVSCLLGLLILAGSTAANALFSMAVTILYFAWLVPIALRFIQPYSKNFVPGPFFFGYKIGWVLDCTSTLYLVFVTFALTLLPSDIPVTAAADMNWSVVVSVGTMSIAALYYVFFARKVFQGPVSTLTDGEFAEVLEAEELHDHKKEEARKAGLSSTSTTPSTEQVVE